MMTVDDILQRIKVSYELNVPSFYCFCIGKQEVSAIVLGNLYCCIRAKGIEILVVLLIAKHAVKLPVVILCVSDYHVDTC